MIRRFRLIRLWKDRVGQGGLNFGRAVKSSNRGVFHLLAEHHILPAKKGRRNGGLRSPVRWLEACAADRPVYQGLEQMDTLLLRREQQRWVAVGGR
jgi:hypothetical protein